MNFDGDFDCCAAAYDVRHYRTESGKIREAVRLALIMRDAGVPADTIQDVVTEYVTT